MQEKPIRLPVDLLRLMRKHAVPLEDDYVSVLRRWGEHYDKSVSSSNGVQKAEPVSIYEKLDPLAPPDLLHTIADGFFDGRRVENWNELLRTAHVIAAQKLGSFAALQRASRAQLREGEFNQQGFHYLRSIGASLQGVDANRAWSYSLRLAKAINVSLQVIVEWREKEGAARPGETAVLEWNLPPGK